MIFIPSIVFTTFGLLFHAPHLNLELFDSHIDIDFGLILLLINSIIYLTVDAITGVSQESYSHSFIGLCNTRCNHRIYILSISLYI
jgi:uncharacterized membrane protein YGL010W